MPRVSVWSSVIGCCFYCLAIINKLGHENVLEYSGLNLVIVVGTQSSSLVLQCGRGQPCVFTSKL